MGMHDTVCRVQFVNTARSVSEDIRRIDRRESFTYKQLVRSTGSVEVAAMLTARRYLSHMLCFKVRTGFRHIRHVK